MEHQQARSPTPEGCGLCRKVIWEGTGGSDALDQVCLVMEEAFLDVVSS